MIIFLKELLSGQNDLESWKQGHNRVYQTKTYRKWYITHWYDHLIFFKMAAILNFKMAANLQHSQEVTLDFLFDFDVTYNVSKGISSTISGSMFAPSNHTIDFMWQGKYYKHVTKYLHMHMYTYIHIHTQTCIFTYPQIHLHKYT